MLAVIVVGIAIAPIQSQFFHKGCAFNQGDTGFDEEFRHVGPPADGLSCPALAGTIAAPVGPVGFELEIFVAVFTAQDHVQADCGKWRPDTVLAKITGDIAGHDSLVGGPTGEQGQSQIVNHLLRHRARPKDVPGHTARVGAIQHGTAHDLTCAGVFGRVQRPPDPGDRQVVQVGALHADLGVLIVQVVAPTISEVSAQTEHATIGGVVQVVLPVTALYIPAADKDVLDVISRQPIHATQGFKLLLGQEWIAAAQRIGHKECARGCDLGYGAIVHEHELGVGLDVVVHIVVRKQAGSPTLIGTLKIVRRTVVKEGPLAGHKLVALDLVVKALQALTSQHAEVRKGALRLGCRTGTLGEVVAQGARAVIAACLEHRVNITVGAVDSDIATLQVFAHDQRYIRDVAVRDRAIGDLIPGVSDNPLPLVVAVAVLVLAKLIIQLDALEVINHQEVDHAGDRIRPVGGRGAAGQHLNALDQRAWNLVDIGADPALQRRAGRQAPAVDQHQGAIRAQVAQIQGSGAGGAIRLAGVLTGVHLRQVAQHVFDPDGALERQVFGVDLDDRAGTDQIGLLDTRAGHDHCFQFLRLLAGFSVRRVGVRGKGRRCGGSQQQCRCHRDPSPQKRLFRHANSFLPREKHSPNIPYAPGIHPDSAQIGPASRGRSAATAATASSMCLRRCSRSEPRTGSSCPPSTQPCTSPCPGKPGSLQRRRCRPARSRSHRPVPWCTCRCWRRCPPAAGNDE